MIFKPNWKIALFTFALLPVLIGFGIWQLDREQEKISLQEAFDARLQASAVDLRDVRVESGSLPYLKVFASGQYDNDRTFLLDNRIHEGAVGYEVIVPFRTDAGTVVLANRGWIAQGPRRDSLPAIAPISGSVQLQGSIYVPIGAPFMLGAQEESSAAEWPKVIQSLDLLSIGNALGSRELFPYTVRLAPESPGALTTNWQVMNMMPEKHRAYAVQWFLMAAVLLGLFIYISIRHPETGTVRGDTANDKKTGDQ